MLPPEFWVFIGGGAGSLGRFWASRWLNDRVACFIQLPLGTLLVNMVGSFLLGFMTVLFRQYTSAYGLTAIWLRVYIPLFFIGFCGGFTTFSSYIMDVYQQFLAGEFMRAWLLLISHVILGLAAAGLGLWLAWHIGSSIVW